MQRLVGTALLGAVVLVGTLGARYLMAMSDAERVRREVACNSKEMLWLLDFQYRNVVHLVIRGDGTHKDVNTPERLHSYSSHLPEAMRADFRRGFAAAVVAVDTTFKGLPPDAMREAYMQHAVASCIGK